MSLVILTTLKFVDRAISNDTFGQDNPMKFTCACCGKIYDEIPALHSDRPVQWYDVPEEKIEEDVYLETDACVIAERFFFIRGLIEIPIIDIRRFSS